MSTAVRGRASAVRRSACSSRPRMNAAPPGDRRNGASVLEQVAPPAASTTAWTLTQEALSLARVTKDRTAEALALYRLGDFARRRGELDAARSLWSEALDMCHEL